jgi:hypothetical protein
VGVKEGEDVKQFVNLKADKAKPELGKERLIEAELEGGADGTKVFWKVTAAKENSKIASSWDMAVLLACFFLSLCHNVVSRALSL